MEKGIKSRRKILEVAFKLFAAYSYPDVSYSLLEEASGISRGSMVYYFTNKEGIFRAVLETFVLQLGSVRKLPKEKHATLKGFYEALVDSVKAESAQLAPYRIANLNNARFNIERSALQFIPEFREQENAFHREELASWEKVIQNALDSGELRPGLDPRQTAILFDAVHKGFQYSGIYSVDEYSLDGLRNTFDNLYNLVKA
jgi:AcrR family transcriptional regulator